MRGDQKSLVQQCCDGISHPTGPCPTGPDFIDCFLPSLTSQLQLLPVAQDTLCPFFPSFLLLPSSLFWGEEEGGG